MFDISIIIFLLAVLGIAAMFISQGKKLKHGGETRAFHSKDLSYDNFRLLNAKGKKIWLEFIHTAAMILSKLWARITHYIGSIFHKGVRHVEKQMIKHEKQAASGEAPQSVFLTTIKTYKKEIKKLQGKVEEELPRPRIVDAPKNVVDIRPDINTIDESKLGE